jgi:hypothetical protein
MTAITETRWQEAQKGERKFWESEDRTALVLELDALYLRELEIEPSAVAGIKVLDLGGGPLPLAVVANLPLHQYTVVDPMSTVDTLHRSSLTVERVTMAAEDYVGSPVGEAWGYNVLQHVIDPARVIATAKAHARRVRWFDWVDTPIESHHPHSISADWLREQFADWRIVSDRTGTSHNQKYIALIAERSA